MLKELLKYWDEYIKENEPDKILGVYGEIIPIYNSTYSLEKFMEWLKSKEESK